MMSVVSQYFDLLNFTVILLYRAQSQPAQFDIRPCSEGILNFSSGTISLFSKAQRQKQPPPLSAPPPNTTELLSHLGEDGCY